MADKPSGNSLIKLAKRSTWMDLVVFLSSEGVGLPMAIGGGEAAIHEELRPALIGFAFGLPLMALGFVFPFIRHRLADDARNMIARTATVWLPVVILLAFIYVVGPGVYQRAATPATPGVAMWAAPIYEGSPLGWDVTSVSLGIGMLPNGNNARVNSLSISGKNLGAEEIHLEDAYLISGIDGAVIKMRVNAGYPASPLWIDVLDAAPVPPRAQIDLNAQFNEGQNGLPEEDFLRSWGMFSVVIQYDGRKTRHDFSGAFVRTLIEHYHPEREPHVSKKKS